MIILINRQFTYAVFLYSKPQDMFEIIVRVLNKLLMSCFFFQKKFCLMPGLKFNLSDVTSFPPENLSGVKKITFRLGLCTGY